MKVLMGCIRFPPAPGGAETHVYELATRMLKRGHDVVVFTSDLYKEIPMTRLKGPQNKASVDGVRVRRFRAHSFGGELHYVFMPSMILPMLKYRCDIVHVHSYGYFHVNTAALKRRLQNSAKMILTPHYHPPWSMWGGAKRRKVRGLYDWLIGRSVVNSADAIIGVSKHEMEHLSDIGIDKSKVRIIPNGIDTALYSPIPDPDPFLEAYDIDEDRRIVLYVGRLASNKGLHVLVKAARRVIKEHQDVLFVLVGEDSGERAGLEARIRTLGLERHFLFTGHIQDDRIFRSAYASSEIFVLPSEYEAFGIVLLEAMACGKPCVATNVGGVSEVVLHEKTGLLVDYGDDGGLANAINRLLEDDGLRMRMGKEGRNWAINNFDWDIIVERTEALYRGVLETRQ